MRLIITAIATLALCGTAAAQTATGTDTSPVATDATTSGATATMDGTMPVDASPATGGGAAAQADAANAGATTMPTTPAEATTIEASPPGGHATGQAPAN